MFVEGYHSKCIDCHMSRHTANRLTRRDLQVERPAARPSLENHDLLITRDVDKGGVTREAGGGHIVDAHRHSV